MCEVAYVYERWDKRVSHHARVSRAPGLVASRREGKMVLHALTARGATLLDAIVAAPRRLWHDAAERTHRPSDHAGAPLAREHDAGWLRATRQARLLA